MEETGLGLTFYRFQLSKSLSTISWALFTVFFMWKVITVYHSVFLVGMIPTINLFVEMLSSVPIGHVIDRRNNTVLNLSASVLMAAGFSVFFFGFSVYLVYISAAVISFGSSLKADTFSAIIKKHVPEAGIGRATSYQQAFTSMSTLVGFGMGALSLVFLSEYAPYLLLSLTAVAVALSIPATEEVTVINRHARSSSGYREVFSFFRKLVGFLLLGLVLNGFIVTLDVYGSGLFNLYLHTGPVPYAVFVAALPAGMLVGSMSANKFMHRIERPFVSATLMLFYPPVLLVLGLSESAAIDIAAVFFLGLILPVINVPMISRLVRHTPREIFGRVFAFVKVFLGSSTPVMATLFSIISIAFPLRTIFVAAALILMPVSVASFRVIRNYYAATGQVPYQTPDQSAVPPS